MSYMNVEDSEEPEKEESWEVSEELTPMSSESRETLQAVLREVIRQGAIRFEVPEEEYKLVFLRRLVSAQFRYLSKEIPYKFRNVLWSIFKSNLSVKIPW